MKKAMAVICVCLCAVYFSACAASVELSERGIVGALGVDYGNGVYKVSVLCFNSDLAEDASGVFDVEFVFGEGQDLHEAFENARQSSSKMLFFGHNTVLVLGRNLVETQIYDAAIYLSQSKEVRLNISVFMADGKAEQIVELNTSDKAHISGTIEKLADGKPNGIDVKVQLFQLLQNLSSNGVKGILPVLETVRLQRNSSAQSEEEEYFDVTVNKIAVIDQNTVQGEAAGDNMTGIFLLQNRVDTLNMTVRLEDEVKAYAALSHVKTSIYVENTDAAHTVNILCTGSLSVVGQSESGTVDLRTMQDAFEQEAAYLISAAYNFTRDKLNTDLFHVEWYLSQATTNTNAGDRFEAAEVPPANVSCRFTVTG